MKLFSFLFFLTKDSLKQVADKTVSFRDSRVFLNLVRSNRSVGAENMQGAMSEKKHRQSVQG